MIKLFPIIHNPSSHYSRILIGRLIVYCITADSWQPPDHDLLAQNIKEKKMEILQMHSLVPFFEGQWFYATKYYKNANCIIIKIRIIYPLLLTNLDFLQPLTDVFFFFFFICPFQRA